MKVSSVKNVQQTYAPNSEGKHARKLSVSPVAVVGVGLVSSLAIYSYKRPPVKMCSEFLNALSQGLSQARGKKVAPYSLSSVMDKNMFLSRVGSLVKDNYTYTKDGFKNFRIMADFHMHTNHSDGRISVPNLLDEIAKYADELHKKTGRKFLFSITDHDSVEGVKEALSIISQDPKKFRHVRFIPGVELSFVHKAPKSSNPCEVSEILAYGFNPFKLDKPLKEFQAKREKIIDEMLAKISEALPLTKFSKDEFIKTFGINRNCFMMNTHWSVFEYAQTKHALTIQASRKKVDPEKLYTEVMSKFETKDKNVWNLKKGNYVDGDINETNIITDIRKIYEPHFENDKLVLTNERSFEELIDLFKGDDDAVLGFAHPYFTATKLNDANKGMHDFINKSKGLIKLSEAYHQAYPKYVNREEAQYLDSFISHLISIGGSDNHTSKYVLN